MKYQEFLKLQMKRATDLGLESEAVRLLILELSGYSGAEFVSMLDQAISEEEQKRLITKIDQYLIERKPVQHIIGYSYFYGYKISVSNDVLIPRPETEELVSYVLSYYDDVFPHQKVNVVDVGTGSGAIAIALVKEEPKMQLVATDISEKALKRAEANAKMNHAKVNFIKGDMLEPLIAQQLKFDILVSNPPYIPNCEYVEDIVKENEPHIALFGGDDGMKFYDVILKDASKVLNTPSILAFEHGYRSKQQMIDLAQKYFENSEIHSIKDLNGKDRITIIINRGKQ